MTLSEQSFAQLEPESTEFDYLKTHSSFGWCWCQPFMSLVPYLDGDANEIIVHRNRMD